MNRFWMVWKVNGGPPAMRHVSYSVALREAQRLAESVGGEFLVLEAVATVSPAPRTVTVEFPAQPTESAYARYDGDGIPF